MRDQRVGVSDGESAGGVTGDDGALPPGRAWVQESVIGSRFEARYQPLPGGRIAPVVTGRASMTAAAWLARKADDPFRGGIAPAGAP